jgi:hypothetical protein
MKKGSPTAQNRRRTDGAQPRCRQFSRAGHAPQRRNCVAGHVGLELRNVVAKYPFERSHRFPVIQPNCGRRDYSRSSCDGGRRSSGLVPGISAGCLREEPAITDEMDEPTRARGSALCAGGGNGVDLTSLPANRQCHRPARRGRKSRARPIEFRVPARYLRAQQGSCRPDGS